MATQQMLAPDRSAPARAVLAWLSHPVTLVCAAVLVVNNQLLKAAFPGPVTGKLSDLAGLVVAPPLLALVVTLLVPRLPAAAAAVTAVAVTGAGFTLVKGTVSGAAAASGAWSAVNGPSVVLADRTDLLAVPALALAWSVWRRARRRPAPHPLFRLARVLVVLPAAAFAVAATSAPAYPYAMTVTEWDGAVVVGEDIGYHPDPDAWQWTRISDDHGRTWRDLDDPEHRGIAAAVDGGAVDPARQAACVPGRPADCYRVVPGHLRVERSRDGGSTWRVAWEITDVQRRSLYHHYPDLGDPAAYLSSRALAVVPVHGAGGDHVVMVANGRDGYVRYDGRTGQWERIGFGEDASAYFADPPDVTGGYGTLRTHYLWGLAGALLTLLVTSEVLRRRRAASWRAVGTAGLVVVAAGVAGLFVAARATNAWRVAPDPPVPELLVFLGWGAAVAVTALGLALWLSLLGASRALSGRQWLVLVPGAVLVGGAVTVPLASAAGRPVAFILAVLFWGAGTTAVTAAAWAVSRRPARPGPTAVAAVPEA